MGFYEDQILPRLVDWVCSNKQFSELREPFLKSLEGIVLEIGFGSGTNLPFYPVKVKKLIAIDPSTKGRELARDRLKEAKFPVEFIDYTNDQRFPLPDGSVDHVVSSFTLCTISDLEKVLSEVKRVLRPGGRFHFLEHGRSPDKTIAKWQDRLTPIQKVVAGGCHLNREFDRIIKEAGFLITKLEKHYAKGPKVAAYIYEGSAVVPNPSSVG